MLFQPSIHSKYQITFSQVELTANLKNVAAAFGCEDIKKIEQVQERELNSNNFKISGSKTILLRKNISNNKQSKIELEYKLLNWLLEQKIKVPRPLLTNEANVFASDGTNFYTAYEFIAGDHYRGNFSELEQAACEISKLHHALKVLPFKQLIESEFQFLTNIYKLDFLEKVKQQKSDSAEIDLLLQTNYELIETATLECTEKIKLEKNLQLIHGDLHPHNFIFETPNLQAIIDFGEMRLGPIFEDIAYAAYRLTRRIVVDLMQQQVSENKILATISEAKQVFASAYSHTEKIEDWNTLHLMIKHIALKKIYFILSQHYLNNNSRWNFDLAAHINSLREANYFA